MNLEYQNLIRQWEKETGHHFSLKIIFENKNFKSIVSHGMNIVPDIFLYLKESGPSFLCEALRQICGKQFEVPKDKIGRIDYISEEWLKWGKEYNYI